MNRKEKVSLNVIEAILPHLSPEKVDGLRLCNQELAKFIDIYRLDFPLHEVPILSVLPRTDKYFLYAPMTGNQTYAKSQDVAKYIQHLKVKELRLLSPALFGVMSARWFQNCDMILVREIRSDDMFSTILSKVYHKNLSLNGSGVELDVDAILERMPSMRNLEVNCAKYSKNTIKKLIEKSKAGSGVELLEIDNRGGEPFNTKDVIFLAENLKFMSPQDDDLAAEHRYPEIMVGWVSESKEFYDDEIEKLKNRPEWDVNEVPVEWVASRHVIRTPTTVFTLTVTQF